MAAEMGNGKTKKTSRGMRKHVRRMKQDTRKSGVPLGEWKKKVTTQSVPKKEA